jgi:hypothetical protein
VHTGGRACGSDLCVRLQGRIKSLYSMYRKMIRKGVSLREVFDALALRVVVDDQNGYKMQQAIEVRSAAFFQLRAQSWGCYSTVRSGALLRCQYCSCADCRLTNSCSNMLVSAVVTVSL